MTKTDALLMMLQIIQECRAHTTDNGGCRECALGCGPNCLVSAGNDIPTDWLITHKVYEWTKGEK